MDRNSEKTEDALESSTALDREKLIGVRFRSPWHRIGQAHRPGARRWKRLAPTSSVRVLAAVLKTRPGAEVINLLMMGLHSADRAVGGPLQYRRRLRQGEPREPLPCERPHRLQQKRRPALGDGNKFSKTKKWARSTIWSCRPVDLRGVRGLWRNHVFAPKHVCKLVKRTLGNELSDCDALMPGLQHVAGREDQGVPAGLPDRVLAVDCRCRSGLCPAAV